MNRVALLFALALFQGVVIQSACAESAPSSPLDEIIGFSNESGQGNTQFVVFQYDDGLSREGGIDHYTMYTGWIIGDIDGDGVDEITSYDVVGGNTNFIIFQYDGSGLVREGDTSHYTQYDTWNTGDIDGDGTDEIIASQKEGDNTQFLLFRYDGALTVVGVTSRVTSTTGWLAGDIDGDGVDEIVTYDATGYGKTEFIIYEYGSELSRKGSFTYYTQHTGWLAGDVDGDGVDEITSYDVVGGNTNFIIFQYDGSGLVREGDTSYYLQYTAWFTGDIDESLNITSYSPSDASLEPEERGTVNFSIEALQADGALSSYSWKLDGVEVANSSTWSYETGSSSAGTHTVVGLATDGKLNVSKEWSVEVKESSGTISVKILSPKSGEIMANDADITWEASHIDGDELSIDVSYSDDAGKTWNLPASGEENDGSYTWDTKEVSDGEYLIKIIASDSQGASVESSHVSVTIGNSPPKIEIISPPAGTVDELDRGSLYISSTPSGASIKIDGEGIGKTDREIEPLAGFHTVEIYKEGYFPWTDWIEVEKGSNPPLSVRLVPNLFGFSPVQIMAAVLSLVFIVGILLYIRG